MAAARSTSGIPRVAILGAGVGGLAAGVELRRLAEERGIDLEIRVFDAADRAGGCAGTEVFEGARLERGPDTFVTYKPAGVALCERLGLGSRLEHPPAGSVAVWHDGRLVPVPEGFALVAPLRRRPLLASPLLSWPGRLRAWYEPLMPTRPDFAAADDESVASFVRRRFGDELYRRISEPLVGSISMSDVETLSMAASFPRIAALEHQPGRVSGRLQPATTIPTGPAVATLGRGMGELVDALVARLPVEALRLGHRVASVHREAVGYRLDSDDRPPFLAEALIVATPANATGAMLRTLDPALAEIIEATRYASCVTVNVAWPREALARAPRLHGFFVPRNAGLPFVAAGVIGEKFPDRVPSGLCVVRAFCGGALHPEAAVLPTEALTAQVTTALAEIFGARTPPAWVRIFRHQSAMPQATVGHLERVGNALRRAGEHPGLALGGGPLGAYGLPDVIAGAETAAAAALAALAGPR